MSLTGAKIDKEETDLVETGSGYRKFFLKVGGVLAYILHPVLLFFYCFLFVHFLFGFQNSKDSIWFIVYVFGLSVFLPALFSVWYSGDPYLRNRKKRPLVILFTFICYAVLFYIVTEIGGTISILKLVFHSIHQQEITQFVIYFQLLVFLMAGMFLLFIISFWYKISLHANGIGFLLAIPFMPGIPWLIWIMSFNSFFLTGVIIVFLFSFYLLLWQRVASGSHKLMEVVSGFALGFGITILLETLLR